VFENYVVNIIELSVCFLHDSKQGMIRSS